MEEKTTPMLQQYNECKQNYPDCVVFFRLGDFYEMFSDDAINISRELELTLTARAGIPMCGVPHHASEIYINRLVKKGYKIAICEQMEDPATAKGLVKREVVRVVTPGTVLEDSMLEDGKNNYIACLYAEESGCGMVFADISTGDFHVFEKRGDDFAQEVIDEMSRYMPVEIIFNEKFLNIREVHQFIKVRLNDSVGNLFDEEQFLPENAEELQKQYIDIVNFEIPIDYPLACKCLNAVFGYINDTQKSNADRKIRLVVHTGNDYMNVGVTTRRNLELTETMRNKENKGSLFWVLDKTKTSMGKRRLRQYIEQPLVRHADILARLYAVEKLASNVALLGDISQDLSGVYDLERLINRIAYRVSSPRDLYALGKTCTKIPQLKNDLSNLSTPLLDDINANILNLKEVADLISNAIVDNPPANTKDGGYIRECFNEDLDELRKIATGGHDILKEIEVSEREKTGIKNLKVGYNRVFGYYIEVSKGNIPMVPAHYIRKQTLTNGERYITEELKKIESEIIGANGKILALEADILSEVVQFVTSKIDDILRTADAIADIDVLAGFAKTAIENNYVKPDISLDPVIEIKDGRHPVIEKMMNESVFTPNDVYMDIKTNRLLILTGPNMAGKSTFMRQIALITLMAQIGSFVPAKYARLGVVDKIFTRVGASDDLSAGQSTFMVEMSEVAEILRNATSKSLVILDEIGRGTSTFDGMSIAKAVAEYINSKAIGCKTLFATHYHELTALATAGNGIRNFSVAVSKKGDEIKFLHKIVEGGTNNSYGIEVAKLAGVPQKVITAAKNALKELELNSKINLEQQLKEETENEKQVEFALLSEKDVIQQIRNLDIDNLTPKEAFMQLSDFKEMLR